MGWKLFAWNSNGTVNGFEWVEETSQFNKHFIKSSDNDSDERYFLKVDVKDLKELHGLQNDLPFLPERMRIGNDKKNIRYFVYIVKK